MSLTRVGVLASGRGSNMLAIAAAIDRGEIPAEIVVVISNRAGAPVLERARERGCVALELRPQDFVDAAAHELAMVAALRDARVEWVCLAGYMRILGPAFISAFPDRILNIHPSLLPAFPGLAAQRQALQHGVTISGCTVHLVDQGLDSGPIVGQAAVPVHDDDDEAVLAARILVEEHELYSACLRRLLTQAWRIQGRRLCWHPPAESPVVA